MEKAIGVVVGIAFVALLWLGVMWGLWSLWCWVLPQFYASGPHNIVSPGFWLFAGAWTLLSLVGRAIFGHGKSE
jgi:predicted membrane metal-binding protein